MISGEERYGLLKKKTVKQMYKKTVLQNENNNNEILINKQSDNQGDVQTGCKQVADIQSEEQQCESVDNQRLDNHLKEEQQLENQNYENEVEYQSDEQEFDDKQVEEEQSEEEQQVANQSDDEEQSNEQSDNQLEEDEYKEAKSNFCETAVNEKVEKLENELKNFNDKHLRLMAEYDNYRKRTLKEKAELMKTGGEKILLGILPLIDDFERAQQHIDKATDIDAVKAGITLIYNKFVNFLSQQGIKEIETIGKDFDAEIYEALTKIPAPTQEMKGKIIDCIEKGYMLDDKLIRYPKVVVGE